MILRRIGRQRALVLSPRGLRLLEHARYRRLRPLFGLGPPGTHHSIYDVPPLPTRPAPGAGPASDPHGLHILRRLLGGGGYFDEFE